MNRMQKRGLKSGGNGRKGDFRWNAIIILTIAIIALIFLIIIYKKFTANITRGIG